MDWKISRQNAVTVEIIFFLYTQMDMGRPPRTRENIVKILRRKNFSEDRIGYALNYLINDKLAYRVEGEAQAWRLTSTGVHWVEYNFHIERSGSTYTFTPRHKTITLGPDGAFKPPAVRPVSNSHSIDWAKWGAIGSILALPVAFLLWWLS